MNFNLNRRNERKIEKKNQGGALPQITHISVVKCLIVPNLILN